jgi:hypothetical protein
MGMLLRQIEYCISKCRHRGWGAQLFDAADLVLCFQNFHLNLWDLMDPQHIIVGEV